MHLENVILRKFTSSFSRLPHSFIIGGWVCHVIFITEEIGILEVQTIIAQDWMCLIMSSF